MVSRGMRHTGIGRRLAERESIAIAHAATFEGLDAIEAVKMKRTTT